MEQIANFVEAMFQPLPKTEEVRKIKEDILENMQEKYNDLLDEGKNEYEALGIVISQFGSMEELCRGLDLDFGREQPQPGPDSDAEHERLQREYERFLPRQRLAVAAAVFLFILSPIAGGELDSPLLFFGLIAAGVGLLIYFCGRARDYRSLLGLTAREQDAPFIQPTRRGGLWGIVMLAAAIVYLILGFSMGLWHPGWIIFLIAPLLVSLIEYFGGAREDKGEEK